jgi:uncharacterized protein YggE
MRLQSLCAVIALSFVAFGPAPARAQADDAGTVTGTGSVSLERTPDRMRVQVALFGKGAGIKEALEALEKRTDAARTQLNELKVEKDSIAFDPPKVTTNPDLRIQRIELMLAQRRGKKAKKADKSVTVTSTLTAEFKIDAKDARTMLLAVHPLQEKIREADLSGAKEAEKLTPEQEELLEEAEAQGYSYGGEEQKPGDPVFLFVSRIKDEDRDQALAEAFQKAKAQAAKLAKAAGSELGALKSLTDQDYSGTDYGEDYVYNYAGNYNSPAFRAVQMARSRRSGEEAHEALGAEPGPVKFSVTVSASFDLKGAK